MRKGSIGFRGKSWYFKVDIGTNEITGKRMQKYKGGFPTRPAAQNALEEFKKENIYDKVNTCESLFREIINEWLIKYVEPHLSPNTFRSYKQISKDYFIPYLGRIRINDITMRTLEDYYCEILQNEDLSYTTVKYHHRLLKNILNYAIKNTYIVSNPAQCIKLKKVQKEQTILSNSQVRLLIDSIKNLNIFLPAYFSLLTGIRRSELCALKWTDIDLENKRVRITKSLIIDKKFEEKYEEIIEIIDKEKGIILVPTKTERSKRTISIPEDLVEELIRYRNKQKKLQLKLSNLYFDKDFVFTYKYGYPYNPNYLTKSFKKVIQRIDTIPNDYHWHCLRHQYASICLTGYKGKSASIIEISKNLGHSDIETTIRLYSHLIKDSYNSPENLIIEVLNAS